MTEGGYGIVLILGIILGFGLARMYYLWQERKNVVTKEKEITSQFHAEEVELSKERKEYVEKVARGALEEAIDKFETALLKQASRHDYYR